ncbi:MAG: hypothetical protein HC805_04025, partial [Alkalinema sp. RL_2_19]|nr:hypothetical protein [Alkalinema sp. RL_2_19]
MSPRLMHLIDQVIFPQTSGPIVVFIDEVDSVLGLPFATHDFFGLIRNCYNRRAEEPAYQRLTFVLLGVTTPTALIQDKRYTPFNIGQAISLSGFRGIEALPLLNGLQGICEQPQTLLQQILGWTNGQPFLTQKVCRLAAEHLAILPDGNVAQAVQQLVREYVIERWESQDEPEHLRTIRDRLMSDPVQAVQLLTYYQRILLSPQGHWEIDSSAIQRELILSGIVQPQDGFLQVKNRIYEMVFDHDWVDQQFAQLVQQGVITAAALTSDYSHPEATSSKHSLPLTWHQSARPLEKFLMP